MNTRQMEVNYYLKIPDQNKPNAVEEEIEGCIYTWMLRTRDLYDKYSNYTIFGE